MILVCYSILQISNGKHLFSNYNKIKLWLLFLKRNLAWSDQNELQRETKPWDMILADEHYDCSLQQSEV